MISCLIVDDEPLAIRVLEHHLADIPDVRIVGTTTLPTRVGYLLQRLEVDLLFLDIEMPGASGLEIARSLDNPPLIVFTTAHRNYAVEGFDVAAVDYLVKPIGLPRLLKALGRVRSRLETPAASAPQPAAPAEPDAILINVGRRMRRVRVARILYGESIGDYVSVHTTTGRISSRMRISDFADELADRGFLRVHRSFVVNMSQVTAWSGTELTVGSDTVPVSRSYRVGVMESLNASGAG